MLFNPTSLALAHLTVHPSIDLFFIKSKNFLKNISYASLKDMTVTVYHRYLLMSSKLLKVCMENRYWYYCATVFMRFCKLTPVGDFWLQLLRRWAVAMANKSASIWWNTRHLHVPTCVTTLRPDSSTLIRNKGRFGENGCKDGYHPYLTTHTHTRAWYYLMTCEWEDKSDSYTLIIKAYPSHSLSLSPPPQCSEDQWVMCKQPE